MRMPETHQPAATKGCSSRQLTALSLDLVLRVCPDITAYAANGVHCWRDLLNAASVVSSFLGIAETAWREASVILGREGAATVVFGFCSESQRFKALVAICADFFRRRRMGSSSSCPYCQLSCRNAFVKRDSVDYV